MNALKNEIDQVIMHKLSGQLGTADLLVTEALINNLRRLQNEQLIDNIIAHEIAANDHE